MSPPSKEERVILALQALQNDKKISLRAAAKLYDVPVSTLYGRRAGQYVRRDLLANSYKLTDLEEQTIVQYILNLSTRAFSPRLCGIEDIAN
jgi:predicted transcriptional regulator